MDGRKTLAKLTSLARCLRYKVIIKNTSEGARFSELSRRIYLDDDDSDPELVATLLHEIGHILDLTLNYKDYTEELDVAYERFYDEKANKKQKRMVLSSEKRAWAVGKKIAKQLKIPLGKWFDDEQKVCLDSYRSIPCAKSRNRV